MAKNMQFCKKLTTKKNFFKKVLAKQARLCYTVTKVLRGHPERKAKYVREKNKKRQTRLSE